LGMENVTEPWLDNFGGAKGGGISCVIETVGSQSRAKRPALSVVSISPF